jgi:hypothetical protein
MAGFRHQAELPPCASKIFHPVLRHYLRAWPAYPTRVESWIGVAGNRLPFTPIHDSTPWEISRSFPDSAPSRGRLWGGSLPCVGG